VYDLAERTRLAQQNLAVFNLSVGMGSSEQRFVRQEQALRAFVADNAEELDKMPYAVATVNPSTRQSQLRGVETVIRRSVVAPGILGVFPMTALPPLSSRSSAQQRSDLTGAGNGSLGVVSCSLTVVLAVSPQICVLLQRFADA